MRGNLLVATPDLEDPNFARTVVLVLEHSPEGAVGVVLNRPSPTPLGEGMARCVPLAASPAQIFVGGPVEADAAIGLGRAVPGSEREPGAQPLFGSILTVDLGSDPALVGADLDAVRVFAGYAGWGPGQLDDEVLADVWFVLERTDADVFTKTPERLWREVLRRQPGPLRLLSTFPADPSSN